VRGAGRRAAQDFRDYVAVRDILRRRRPRVDDDDWRLVERVLDSYALAAPDGDVDHAAMLDEIDREVAPSFPKLAQNQDFLTLLDGFTDVERLREKLRRFSATTARRPTAVGRIFIAYRRDDSTGHVRRLYDGLRAHFGEERLFADASITVGADFQQTLLTAVGSARVVLAVIGPNWEGPWLQDPSNWLRRELGLALARPDIRVVPLLVGGARFPSPETLPDDLAPLLSRQGFELSDADWRTDVARLVDQIEYVLAVTFESVLEQMQAASDREQALFDHAMGMIERHDDAATETVASVR
jgi:hypothetical protein